MRRSVAWLRHVFLWSLLVPWSSTMAADAPLYRDAQQPIDVRVEDLLARMTLDEKIGQMTQVNATRLMGSGEWDRGPLNDAWVARTLSTLHVGSVLSGGGAAPVPNTPTAWAEMTNALQRHAIEHSRLGIPLIYGVDAVHGHNSVVGATIYPHNIGLAASWDPALVEAVAARTSTEVRATGIHWNFAPVADIGRDARWGRFYETFGEDPLLVAELVAASVRGGQSTGDVAMTVKHFIGYGAAEDGRDRAPAFISEEELWDLDLPPFEAGLAVGALSVMVNSGALNGVPVHASQELLSGLLRERLGFEGVIVSDWNDIERLVSAHGFARDFPEAVALGINAGLDVYMVPHDAQTFTRTLRELVDSGVVPMARIDDAVTRVLTLKMTLGLFEQPFVDAARAERLLTTRDTLAYEAALASLTLLENDGVLPLRDGARVLVTGPSARSVADQMGGWTIGWQGVERADEMPPAVTLLDGLTERAPAGTIVTYADGRDLAAVVEAAAQADVVVAVVGEGPYAEGAGDVRSLALAGGQRDLLRALQGTGTPVVAVLVAGRPLTLPEDLHQGLAGLVMAYLPGSEGGSAVADALYGRAGFSGRLPFAWPAHGEVPRADAAAAPPAYAFGFGLGYTRFEYADVTARIVGDAVHVALEVANVGADLGRETVQVFVAGAGDGSAERLLGFATLELEPGTSRRLRLELPLERLAAGPERTVARGDHVLRVGDARVTVRVP